MMKQNHFVVASIVAFRSSSINISLADTGYELLQRCQNGHDANNLDRRSESARCDAYISGVFESAAIIDDMKHVSIFCQTPRVTRGQVTLIYMSWAKDHPQYLNRDAAENVLVALSAAFPCPAR